MKISVKSAMVGFVSLAVVSMVLSLSLGYSFKTALVFSACVVLTLILVMLLAIFTDMCSS